MRLMDMRSESFFSASLAIAVIPGLMSRMKRYYCLSILDKHHHPDITFDQGMKILRMCTDELQRRMPIDFKGMVVKKINKDGVEEVEYDMTRPVHAA